MPIPIRQLPQTQNNFLGPVMQAVDTIVKDIKTEKEKQYIEQQKREIFAQEAEKNKKNKNRIFYGCKGFGIIVCSSPCRKDA